MGRIKHVYRVVRCHIVLLEHWRKVNNGKRAHDTGTLIMKPAMFSFSFSFPNSEHLHLVSRWKQAQSSHVEKFIQHRNRDLWRRIVSRHEFKARHSKCVEIVLFCPPQKKKLNKVKRLPINKGLFFFSLTNHGQEAAARELCART